MDFLRLSILVLVVGSALARAEDCDNPASVLARLVDNETARDAIYSTPFSGYSGNTCGLEETCCSPKAELYFLHESYKVYQTRLHTILNTTIHPCLNDFNSSRVLATTSEFIGASKANMIGLVTAISGTLIPGSNISNMFNPLYTYLDNGVKNFDLCDLKTQFEDMIFQVYLATFTGVLRQSSYITPTDTTFLQCLRGYVLSTYSTQLETDYQRLQQRFNLFFRWLTALRTGEETISEIQNYTLSNDCINALFKLDTCALCSGEAVGVTICPGFCNNTLRGCLVDLTEFLAVFDEYVEVLESVQNVLNTYNPFESVNLLQNRVSNIIGDFFSTNANALTNLIGDRCGVTFERSTDRRRRDVSDLSEHLTRRQATAGPVNAIDDAVTCFKSAVSTLQELPDTLCSEVNLGTANHDCWNGHSIGNYSSTVPKSNRVSQLDNPTLCVRPYTGLAFQSAIARLKFIAANASACSSNVLNCDIKLCEITLPAASDYDLSMNSRYNVFPVNESSNCAEKAPFIIQGPANQSAISGGLTFTCSAVGYPEAALTWYHNNTVLDASTVNITTVVTLPDLEGPLVKQISTLAIPADHVKEGIYTCNATNSAGSAKASATFTRAVAANLIALPSDVTILAGSEAVFTCTFEAYPVPDVEWQFTDSNGTTNNIITSSDRYTIGLSIGDKSVTTTLTIASTAYADRGVYSCSASNVIDGVVYTATSSAILTVYVAPTITLTAESTAVTEYNSISLTCGVRGSYPSLRVQWLKESQLIIADDRISIDGEPQLNEDTQLYDAIYTLSIDSAVTSDTGVYTCRTLPYPLANPILPAVLDSLAVNVTVRNECLPDPPCVNGYCVDDVGDYTCVCYDGYTGRNCDESVPVLIQHDGEVVDENGVYLNDDDTVTLSCIVSDCEATGEWTSSSDASFTSTDLSITVTTPAIYTCTATGCGSASINVQERGCISEQRFCHLVAAYNLCSVILSSVCCISCPPE